MDDLLTDEDRKALYDALCTQPMHLNGDHDHGACIVERDVTFLIESIVRRHRAEAAAQELHYAARQVSYGVEWDDAPLSVEDWLHDRAYTLEMTDE